MIYIITFIYFISVSYLQVTNRLKNKERILYVAALFLMIFQNGFRWQIGTDWLPYLEHFKSIQLYGIDGSYEMFYNYFAYVVSLFTDSYTVFLLIHATIVYILYFYWIKKFLSANQFVALLVFYASTIGFMGMNRQHISIALCLFSTPFYLRKKYWIFIIINYIAFGFHTTAIIFPFMVLLANRKITVKTFVLLIILSFVMNQFLPLNNIFFWFTNRIGESTAEKSTLYLNIDTKRTLLDLFLNLLRKTLVLVPIFLLRKRIDWNNPFFILALNMYVFGIMMTILFNGSLQFLVGRFTLNYVIFECILWAFIAQYIKNKLYKKAYVFFLLIYAIFVFYRSIILYPELFIPYKSVFTKFQIL